MMSSNYTATSRTQVQFPLPQPTHPDTETKLKPSLLVPSRSVSHEYHDHSQDAASTQLRGMDHRFPDRLFRLLDDKSNLSHILAWRPHGRCFAVHNRQEFVRSILPRYFRQTKMTSFQRQLNIYGFKRLTGSGPDKDCYYHELFLRGRPDLCSRMVRTKINGKVKKETPSPSTEPNFYSMTPCGVVVNQARLTHTIPHRERKEYQITVGDRDEPAASQYPPPSYLEPSASQTILFDNPTMTRAQGCVRSIETLDSLLVAPIGDFHWDDHKDDRDFAESHSYDTALKACTTSYGYMRCGVVSSGADSAGTVSSVYEPVPYENVLPHLHCNDNLDLPLIRQLFIDESTHLV